MTQENEAAAMAQKAEDFWSSLQTADPLRGYWANPYLGEIAEGKTGGKWYLEYVRDKYFGGKPAKHALSVGCGAGEVDRAAYARGVFDKITGIDFSHGGLEVARKEAEAAGLPATYIRKDFNQDTLPDAERFDLIFDYASSHHIANLEHLIKEIERVLADDGIFVLYGYCGPARMQWPTRVIEQVNKMLSRMPERLRTAMPILGRPSLWEFMAGDPSEAVRGPEVVDVIRSVFDVVEDIDIGYTLSHPMFSQNAYSMDPNSPSEQSLFRLVCEYEQLLMESNVIGCDTKVMVCRRRPLDHFRPAR